MNSVLIFDISEMMDASTGTRELYSFEGKLDFDNIPGQPQTSGKVEIMRGDDGFNVQVTNIQSEVEMPCHKCLDNFKTNVVIDRAEREFSMEAPAKIIDPFDVFIIDKKALTLDITEILRQEIILHLPLIPVCSESCKGICHICGKDKNREKCDCVDEILPQNTPLSSLKDLLKK